MFVSSKYIIFVFIGAHSWRHLLWLSEDTSDLDFWAVLGQLRLWDSWGWKECILPRERDMNPWEPQVKGYGLGVLLLFPTGSFWLKAWSPQWCSRELVELFGGRASGKSWDPWGMRYFDLFGSSCERIVTKGTNLVLSAHLLSLLLVCPLRLP